MSFDFDAAVQAPFRMQPGLRRVAAGATHLTPLAVGAPHQHAKLAVLASHANQALCCDAGFNALPAVHALCSHAAAEHPHAWQWDGRVARAALLDMAVEEGLAGDEGHVHAGPSASHELVACLEALPAAWRLAGLLSLAFAQDFAVLDGRSTRIPWLAVALPSHWAPEEKVGRLFTEVHAPVADNAMLLRAAEGLAQLVTGDERWERFVWTVSPHGALDAHPRRLAARRWEGVDVAHAWWRTERQTFIPVPQMRQAVFTIHVEVCPLAEAIDTPARATQLHAAIASMSPQVLDYRGLTPVREPLLAWLATYGNPASHSP
ncbi:heme-dependent oxidative N-demethylase subunit alpha family protein [Variovorax sp. VNK109]|uniref:heme-dependent oxidative N-demethylase subunit alpha family protein n=1 Tax=Variovorax sp. VNK109 TaxID=3400919 RepID=UPI003C10B211